MRIKNIVGNLIVNDNSSKLSDIARSIIDNKYINCFSCDITSDDYINNLFNMLIPTYEKANLKLYNCRVSNSSGYYPKVICWREHNNIYFISDCKILVSKSEEVSVKIHSAKIIDIKNDDVDKYSPILINREKNSAEFLKNQFLGAHCFVVSSGPSFKCFSNKEKLKFVFTASVNNAAKAMMPHSRPNLMLFVDHPSKFLYTQFLDPQTMIFCPSGHFGKGLYNSDLKKDLGLNTTKVPNIYFYKRNSMFDPQTFLTENSINWGNSSDVVFNKVKGKRSCLIALLKLLYFLGFRHVYLLGCDFYMNKDNPYSFEQSRNIGSINGNNSTYNQLNVFLNALQPNFLKSGYNVYNLNKDSKLTVFPFLSFDEAFDRALSFVSNVNEYVSGKLEDTTELYNTNFFKCPSCKLEKMYDTNDVKSNKAMCQCGNNIKREMKKKYF